jgi:hypothetical protein
MAGISITLAGNFAKLDELKDKAHKTAGSIKAAFGSNISKAMFAGVAAASAAAFAGVVAAVKSAIDAGGELQDMMARTGAAGKGLVIMQRAFENAGLAASQVPQALNRMQKALAGVNDEGQPTNEAFAKLGLSISDLLTLDPVEAFKRTAEAIAGIQDPAQRATIAMELFGKSGGEMLAVLTDPAAFSGAAEQVGSLGDTLADNAAALDAVGDAFGALDTKVQQIGAEVAVALLPQLEALGQWLNETDFSSVGGGIGIIVEKVAALAEMLAEASKYMPLMILMNKMADLTIGGDLTDEDKAKARKMADDWAANDPMAGKSRTGVEAQKKATANQVRSDAEFAKGAKEREKEAKEAERAAKAAEKKAEAERKSAAEKEKSKAAAVEDYNMESRILSARLAGDKIRLAALEREKAIREEIKRLESAGFTKAEATRPAEAKVDAEKKAADKEAAQKQAQEEKTKLQEKLAGKVNQFRDKLDDLQYQSSIGSISSMQRVGGGGGAVGSGLDYQRQVADLQREANGYLRELIEVSRKEIEV